ncbi:Uncharacterised protein [Candidatus Gugararchaeum adminiculabundum]|nr:Uncharacterised protein [Candidatus Gugararchaeum adminiculabundum]
MDNPTARQYIAQSKWRLESLQKAVKLYLPQTGEDFETGKAIFYLFDKFGFEWRGKDETEFFWAYGSLFPLVNELRPKSDTKESIRPHS